MSFRLPIVRWKPTGPESEWSKEDDDFVWTYENYCLRVEQMDENKWWWCVYLGNDYLEFDDPFAKNMQEAMAFAEAGFYSHLIGRVN